MSASRAHDDNPAYQDGYDDACAVTNELLGTLMEDVENYHRAYLRILRQYEAHMQTCSRRDETGPAPMGEGNED